MTSFSPPTPVSLLDMTSSFHPCRSAYLLYIRNSSPANSAASSPPVPARISRTMFFSSFGSFGMSSTFSSATSASRLATSDLSSSRASSRMSASPAATSSSVWPMSRTSVLYSRKRSTIGSISESSFESFRNADGSVCASALPRCARIARSIDAVLNDDFEVCQTQNVGYGAR